MVGETGLEPAASWVISHKLRKYLCSSRREAVTLRVIRGYGAICTIDPKSIAFTILAMSFLKRQRESNPQILNIPWQPRSVIVNMRGKTEVGLMSWFRESNPGHLALKANALPTELNTLKRLQSPRIIFIIDFQIINVTRLERGDNTDSISPTDNVVTLFIWRSIEGVSGVEPLSKESKSFGLPLAYTPCLYLILGILHLSFYTSLCS